ncbi:MAG: hypothetical protein JNL57_06670 [Bacteroidetes bacterium]|nr:hypothetical protein [Bacteroidota bacterium]
MHRIIKTITICCLFAGLEPLQGQTDSTGTDSTVYAPDSAFIPAPDSVFVAGVEDTTPAPANEPVYAKYTPPLESLSLRLINGHTTHNLYKGELEFCIQHRFGILSGGNEKFFGLDESNIRIGFDYGVRDWLTVGIGRSGMGKTINGYTKFRLVKQGKWPVSAAWLSDWAINGLKKDPVLDPWYNTHRYRYTHQLIVSRSFGNRAVIHLLPTLVHRNLVDSIQTPNDLFLLMGTARVKIVNGLNLTAEYSYMFHSLRKRLNPSAGIGVELYTGRHIFQFTFTNANSMNEPMFLTDPNGAIRNGDIRFGFNIVRRW